MPEIIHDEENIKGFFGEYRWLSNFGRAHVVLDGIEYESTEKAYQAAKWPLAERQYFLTCTNEEAIIYNRANNPTGYPADDWDAVKVDVMEFLLRQKFDAQQNPANTKLLLDTGQKYLEETNWWGDTFWGMTLDGKGGNHLGELLMRIRQDIRVASE